MAFWAGTFKNTESWKYLHRGRYFGVKGHDPCGLPSGGSGKKYAWGKREGEKRDAKANGVKITGQFE